MKKKFTLSMLSLALTTVFTISCSSGGGGGGSNDNGEDFWSSGGKGKLSSDSYGGNRSSSSGGFGNKSCDYDGTFTDSRDGYIYKYVKIGTQIWMAENLNYKTSSGSWCYYDLSSNCTKYGRLYTWDAAMNACPSGWHLPTSAEWDILISYAGSNRSIKFKSKPPKWDGTDDYCFSALPGSYRIFDGRFSTSESGYWWSATLFNSSNAYLRAVGGGDNNYFGEYSGYNKSSGISVRCIKGNSSFVEQSSSSGKQAFPSSSGGKQISSSSSDCSGYQRQYDVWKNQLAENERKLKKEQDWYRTMVSGGYSSSALSSQQMVISQIQKAMQDNRSRMSQVSSEARSAKCSVY